MVSILLNLKYSTPVAYYRQPKKNLDFGGVSGGIYFTIHRGWIADEQFYSSDPSDAYHYDSYNIIEISNKKLKYQSLQNGDTYTYLKIN